MRIPCILLLALFILASFNRYDKKVSLSLKDAPLEKVFKEIKRQTGYRFNYVKEHLQNTKNVTINVKDADVETVLDLCCKDQSVTYKIKDNTVIIREKALNKIVPATPQITKFKGTVHDKNGQPIEDVEVSFEGSGKIINTDVTGHFTIEYPKPNTSLTLKALGYLPQTITIGDVNPLVVELKLAIKTLDEALVIAYGKTSYRLNTGAVTKIAGYDIEKSPVNNILAALEGRIPGLLITQNNGLPGSLFKTQVRGQSSIGISPGSLPPNNPLVVIDGVPFAPNNNSLQIVSSGSAYGIQGRSPFGVINLGDIESIEVLKDADATSIYGSRGANGIILITTKQGQPGPIKFNFNVYTGLGKITKSPDMLNTDQYIQMRREALKNDSSILTPNTADLTDTTSNTNFKNLLIANTAKIYDVQTSISGGTLNTQYLFGASFHKESTVYPGNLGDNRSSLHFRLGHNSPNRKLAIKLSANYSTDKEKLITTDLTSSTALPPNTVLYDSSGNLNWIRGNVPFSNPMGYLSQKYHSETENILFSLLTTYKLLNNLAIKVSLGYNGINSNERSIKPIVSLNPLIIPNTGSAYFGNNDYKSWIAEPQAEYYWRFKKGKITALLGGTWQQLTNSTESTTALGYTNDDSLYDIRAAANVEPKNRNTMYRYQGFFGRLSYNWSDKYLLNITGRRDASSRFGAKNLFGNFGAIGAAWVFSNESYLKKHLPFISFGKLRTSYGVTGNDEIGDYKYFDSWTRPDSRYLGRTGLIPTQLSYESYSWETTRKLEAAIELGFLKDRIYLTVDYYRNRTGNQIISFQLPTATGFTSIAAKNSRAEVQNNGFEISLRSIHIATKNANWTSELTMTIPRNKLVSFPGLDASRYAGIFTEGKSLTFQRGYRYLGVDPATGFFRFEDKDNDGLTALDLIDIGNLDPKYYGGIKNSISYKNWQLDIFMEGRRQMGYSFLYAIYNSATPGTLMVNQPVEVLNRWQHPGDRATFQKFTATNMNGANAISNFKQSSGKFEDASFIRLKTISLSYALPEKWLKKTHLINAGVYFQAQNLFTLTGYNGLDPETQSLYTLPPLKIITTGIHCSF